MAYTASPSWMHMAPLLQALIFIGLLLASMSILVPGGSTEEGPSGIEIIRVGANGGFTREVLIDHSVERTHLRAEMLSGTDGDGTGAAAVDNPYQYLVNLSIGTPPVPFIAVPDTGSDLVWTKQLKRCVRTGSSTFSPVTCSKSESDKDASVEKMCGTCNIGVCMFNRNFGNGMKSATGFIGSDTLTLSRRKTTTTTTIDKISVSIGCAIIETDKADELLPTSADGIVGLNRGPMSLVQQLSLANFSYCFSDQREAHVSGRLWLGDGLDFDQLSAGPDGERLQTTELVDVEWTEDQRKSVLPNMYYVQLEGISIGGNYTYQLLPDKSFNLKSKNDKGVMFVDSGCSRTMLEKGVFEALKELLAEELKAVEIVKKMKKGKETTCFRTRDAAATSKEPEMVLYFHGAQMHLPWANYMDEVADGSGTLFCLAILENKGEFQRSILGNFQQQNTYMLYNLTKGEESLSFLQNFDCHRS